MNTEQAQTIIDNATTLDNKVGDLTGQLNNALSEIDNLSYALDKANGHDFLDIQALPWIEKPGAGTGGSSANHGTAQMTQNADGSKRISVVPGPGPNKVGYDNFLFGINGLFIPKIGQVVRVLDTVKFKLSDVTRCQAVEAENQRNMNQRKANMAIAAMLVSKTWGYFHYTGTAGGEAGWLPTTIPFPANVSIFNDWTTWILETLIDDDAQTVTHKSITINGTNYPMNVVQPMAVKDSNSRWDINFQLDSRGCKAGSVPLPFYCDVFRSLRIEFPTTLQMK